MGKKKKIKSKIKKSLNINNKEEKEEIKSSKKDYTNALDLQYLSCYNHKKDNNKKEKNKINIKKLKCYESRILNMVKKILRNSTNSLKNNDENNNEKIPLNIENALLNFSELCIDHFEFSDVSKIIQKNINEFENDKVKNEEIKNEKISKEQIKNNKKKTLKIDLNDTTENRIKNINNLIINKPIKKNKITNYLNIKTVKKCHTFPIQINI